MKGYKLTETTEVTQSAGRSDRRIICCNSCLTKDEAKNKYHYGSLCQVEKIIHIWINRNMSEDVLSIFNCAERILTLTGIVAGNMNCMTILLSPGI